MTLTPGVRPHVLREVAGTVTHSGTRVHAGAPRAVPKVGLERAGVNREEGQGV